MEQLTIDLSNAFMAPKMDKSKPCRSGHVRLLKFLDEKEHVKPQMYEGDITELVVNGGF